MMFIYTHRFNEHKNNQNTFKNKKIQLFPIDVFRYIYFFNTQHNYTFTLRSKGSNS